MPAMDGVATVSDRQVREAIVGGFLAQALGLSGGKRRAELPQRAANTKPAISGGLS